MVNLEKIRVNITKLAHKDRTAINYNRYATNAASLWQTIKRNHALLSSAPNVSTDYLREYDKSVLIFNDINNLLRSAALLDPDIKPNDNEPIARTTENQEQINYNNGASTSGLMNQNSQQPTENPPIHQPLNTTVQQPTNVPLSAGPFVNPLSDVLQNENGTSAPGGFRNRTFFDDSFSSSNQSPNESFHEIDPRLRNGTELPRSDDRLAKAIHDLATACQTRFGEGSDSEPRQSIRVPEVTLTPFEGDPMLYKEFKETFDLIATRGRLEDIDKYLLLRTNLRGHALRCIESLPRDASAYQQAWAMLDSRYDNPRIIAESYLDNVLSAPKTDPRNASTYSQMLFTYLNALYNLQSMHIDVSQIITYLALQKLDKVALSRFEDTMACVNRMPNSNELIDFLNKEYMIRDRQDNIHPKEPPKPPAVKTLFTTADDDEPQPSSMSHKIGKNPAKCDVLTAPLFFMMILCLFIQPQGSDAFSSLILSPGVYISSLGNVLKQIEANQIDDQTSKFRNYWNNHQNITNIQPFEELRSHVLDYPKGMLPNSFFPIQEDELSGNVWIGVSQENLLHYLFTAGSIFLIILVLILTCCCLRNYGKRFIITGQHLDHQINDQVV